MFTPASTSWHPLDMGEGGREGEEGEDGKKGGGGRVDYVFRQLQDCLSV